MKLRKNQIYYTPPSEEFMESWSYVLNVGEYFVEWFLYVIDTRDGPEYLRIAEERIQTDIAQESVQESKPEDKKKLLKYIFTLPIEE